MAINYPNYGSAGLSAEAGVIDKQQRCIQSWWGGAVIFRPEGGCRYLLQLHTRSSKAAEHPAPIDPDSAFDSQNVLKKEKREENSRTHVGASPPQLWNKREVEKKRKENRGICCLHQTQSTPSTSAQTNRQLAFCGLP